MSARTKHYFTFPVHLLSPRILPIVLPPTPSICDLASSLNRLSRETWPPPLPLRARIDDRTKMPLLLEESVLLKLWARFRSPMP